MPGARMLALLGVACLLLGALGAAGAGFYRTHDFYALWSGSRLVAAGMDPYDEVVWCGETEGVSPDAFDADRGIAVCFMRYAYPFWTAIALLPLGILPLAVASTIWLAVSLALAVLALRWCWLAVEGDAGWAPIFSAIVVFSQPFALLVVLGQLNAILLGVVAFVAFALSRKRDAAAGATLALAALKPNVLPLAAFAVLVWSVAAGRPRVTAAGIVAGAALAATSLAVRPDWWVAWLGELFGRQIGYAVQYATVWGLSAVDLGAVTAAPVVAAIVTLVAAGLARGQLRDPVVLTAIAVPVSVFVTPYAWSYDHLVLALPWALVLARAAHAGLAHRWMLLVSTLAVATVAPWILWALASARHTESLTAVVPAATALLAAYAARVSAPPPRPDSQRVPAPPASRPT